MSAATPEWAELLQAAVESRLLDVHTGMPGEVVLVHTDDKSKRQFVDVRPSLRRAVETDDDSDDPSVPFVEEDLPILPRVPVGYPQGGGWFMSVPLAVGDFVWLMFAERSLDQFIASAAKNRQRAVSTGDIGTHTLDGAFALPCGPAPRSALLEGVIGDELVIAHVSGTPKLSMAASGDVTLTGNLHVTGDVTVDGDVGAAEVTAGVGPAAVGLSTHTHPAPGGTTDAPTPGT